MDEWVHGGSGEEVDGWMDGWIEGSPWVANAIGEHPPPRYALPYVFDSVRSDAMRCDWILFDSVRWVCSDSILIRFDSIRFNSIRFESFLIVL